MRRQPYTERGISRVPCVKCGAPSKYQWFGCAIQMHVPVCPVCDADLNDICTTFLFGDTAKPLIADYRKRIGI